MARNPPSDDNHNHHQKVRLILAPIYGVVLHLLFIGWAAAALSSRSFVSVASATSVLKRRVPEHAFSFQLAESDSSGGGDQEPVALSSRSSSSTPVLFLQENGSNNDAINHQADGGSSDGDQVLSDGGVPVRFLELKQHASADSGADTSRDESQSTPPPPSAPRGKTLRRRQATGKGSAGRAAALDNRNVEIQQGERFSAKVTPPAHRVGSKGPVPTWDEH